MRIFALGFLSCIILLFIARFAHVSDEVRGILNRIAYYINLFFCMAIFIHELWRNKDENSRATITSIMATLLIAIMAVVISLNIAHKEPKKDVIFGLALSVSIVGLFLSIDIEGFLSTFGHYGAF